MTGTDKPHLSASQLDELAAGVVVPELWSRQLPHLLACDECALGLTFRHGEELHVRVLALLDEPAGLPEEFEPPLPVVLRELLEAFREGRRAAGLAAPALAEELVELEPEARLARAGELPLDKRLPVAEAVLEEIPRWWHRDPHHADHLAEAALLLLGPVQEQMPLVWPFFRVQVAWTRAWALRGNALRVQGELARSQEALARALEAVEALEGEAPAVRGEVLWYQAELNRGMRHFDSAEEAARDAQEQYRLAGDEVKVGLLELIRAFIDGEAGRSRLALQRLEQLAKAASEETLGEATYLAVKQHLCYRLVEVGRPSEALERLAEVESSPLLAREPLMRCRVGWVKGLAYLELGETDPAESQLRSVFECFREHDMPYDAALAGLDLAVVLLRAGRTRAAEELAQELAPVFLARGIHREATAAGLLVVRAVEEGRATVQLLRELSEFLRRARRDPRLRFEPST